MEPSILLEHLFITSATLAALCIPAISIAYFVIMKGGTKPEDQKRIASVITFGTFSGVMFVICTLLSLILIIYDQVAFYWIVCFLFSIACFSIAIIFFILSGIQVKIKRRIPFLESK